MSDTTKAMIKRIKRNDIVVQVARYIDPSAFADDVWFDGTGPDAKRVQMTASQESGKLYRQSSALHKAEQIVAHLVPQSTTLAIQAADAEAQAWIDLGVPLTPDLRKIVDNKYPVATS